MSEREPWIDSFRKALRNHEEPYQLGAWERFEAHRATRYRHRAWKRALSAAAVLFLGLGLFWTLAPEPDSGEGVASNIEGLELPRVEEQEPRSSTPIQSESDDMNRDSAAAGSPGDTVSDPSEERSPGESVVGHAAENSGSEPVQPGDTELDGSAGSLPLAIFEVREEDSGPIRPDSPIRGRVLGVGSPSRLSGESRTMDRLSTTRTERPESAGRSLSVVRADHREQASPDRSQKVRASDIRPSPRDRAFAWGVAYAPMMNLHAGSAQLAMGAGVHARMELSDTWGLGSALVLSRSQFQSDADPGEANLFQTSHMADGGPTILDSRVQADLVSLEVPLNLRYEVNETVSLSGGLSTVAYLQETYHYRVDYRQSYLSALSTEQGIEFESGERERTERARESEAPMSGLYWGAFYNVGAEFSWLLSNRHWVSVEPFVKIPSGGVSSRDLTYSSGGVQFKLYF